MCGRYSLFVPPADLEDRFDAAFERPFRARYNAAPGQHLPVITNERPETIQHLRWGFVPGWAGDDRGGHINTRVETIREKPSFRDAVEHRRCLVLADGFYEWTDTDHGRQPHRVAFEDGRPFAMAGIWERWTPETHQTGLDAFTGTHGANDEPAPIETFAIVTTRPNDVVAELHDRMPAILESDDERAWLSGPDVEPAIDPHPADELRAYPVSTAVNDPSTDDPSLVEPLES